MGWFQDKVLGGTANFGGRDFKFSLNPRSNMRRAIEAQDDWLNRRRDAQVTGINEAIGSLNTVYSPYRQFGTKAIKSLSDLVDDPSSIRSTPSYQFNLDQGLRASESGAAARGGALSGRTLKELNNYAQNYADNFYGNEMGRRMSLANFGYGMDKDYNDTNMDLLTARGQANADYYGNLSNYARMHEQAGMDMYANQVGMWTGALAGGGGGGRGGGGNNNNAGSNNAQYVNTGQWLGGGAGNRRSGGNMTNNWNGQPYQPNNSWWNQG